MDLDLPGFSGLEPDLLPLVQVCAKQGARAFMTDKTDQPITDEIAKKLWDGFFCHFKPATRENHSIALSLQDIVLDYLPCMTGNEEEMKEKLSTEGYEAVNLGNGLYYLVNPRA
jgi:hypothetical protein